MSTSINYTMEVNTQQDNLMVRTGPAISFPICNQISKGTQITCTETENGWYLHNLGGWSAGDYLKLIKDNGSSFSAVSNEPLVKTPAVILSEEEQALLNSINTVDNYQSDEIDNIRYLFGAPMQFTELTDPRPEQSDLGRTYIQTILTDMSILTITPGKSAFMKEFSSETANEMAKVLLGKANDNDDDDSNHLKELLSGKSLGRYYSFEQSYAEYIEYVNNMCRISAILLGIGESTLFDGSETFAKFDWDIAKMQGNSSWFNFLTVEKSVSFFIDGKQSSFSDGISNSTDSSLVAGALGKTSDVAKEALFLFGKGYQDEALLDTSKVNYESAVNKIIKTLTKNDTLAQKTTDRVSDYVTTLVNGGNVAFPEIYKDSSYTKSYNIEIKLIAPYADPETFYLHILVPLWHLVALSYPRQLGANGYINPFLVRAFCKG